MPTCRSRLQPSSRWFLARYMISVPSFATSPRALPRLIRQHVRTSHTRAAVPSSDGGPSGDPRLPGPESPGSMSNQQPTRVPVTPWSFYKRLEEAPLRPHPPGLSVVVTPILPSPRMADLKLSKHRHVKSLATQLRIQRLRDERNLSDPDWRELLKDLSAMTPDRQTWGTIVLEAPTQSFDKEKLLSSEEVGIQCIMARSGCAIHTSLRHAESKGDCETMTIRVCGPPSRLQPAVDLVLETVGTASLISSPLAVSTANSRHAWERQAKASKDQLPPLDVEALTRHYGPVVSRPVRILPGDPLVVEDVSRPSKWTIDNLDAYIAHITSPRLGLLANKYHSRRGHSKSHVEAVVGILEGLLNDPEAIPFITLTSFHRVLQFVGRFAPALSSYEMRFFWLGTRNPKRLITTETFNILLSSQTRLKDLGRVYTWIRLMNDFECMPNFRTWVIVLRLFESAEIKRYILHILGQKGMLNSPAAIRQIAVLMMPHDAQLALEQGMTLDQFIERQDELYGGRELWLTRKGGNSVMDVFCSHGRFEDAFKVASLMRTPGRPSAAKPDIVTLNMLLTHAATHKLSRLALDTLATHYEENSIQPDDLTYKLLFNIFWKVRMPLTVATIWHCAVLNRKAAKMESWGPIGRALHKTKKLNPALPVDPSELSKHGMQWGTDRRLHTLLSPLVASLTWYKGSYPNDSEQSMTNAISQVNGRKKSSSQTVGNEAEWAKNNAGKTPCPVTSDDLLDPGFFQTHHAASIRESKSRLVTRYMGYLPAVPLHTLLRQAYEKDTKAHKNATSLLKSSDKSSNDLARSSPAPQNQEASATALKQSEESLKDIPWPSAANPGEGFTISSLRETLEIPLRRTKSKIHTFPSLDQITLVADFSSLYWARRVRGEAALVGRDTPNHIKKD